MWMRPLRRCRPSLPEADARSHCIGPQRTHLLGIHSTGRLDTSVRGEFSLVDDDAASDGHRSDLDEYVTRSARPRLEVE